MTVAARFAYFLSKKNDPTLVSIVDNHNITDDLLTSYRVCFYDAGSKAIQP